MATRNIHSEPKMRLRILRKAPITSTRVDPLADHAHASPVTNSNGDHLSKGREQDKQTNTIPPCARAKREGRCWTPTALAPPLLKKALARPPSWLSRESRNSAR